MVQLDEESLRRWKVKRRNTSIAFAIQRFLLGTDYSVKCVTLWIYITTLLKLPHPRLYYACASFAYFVAAIFASSIICTIADQTRSIRKLFFFCNTAVIVGNVIYAIPLSPGYLISGAVISGVGYTLNSVMTGELARSYKDDQLTFQLSLGGIGGNLGFLIAPGMNIAFSSIDWKFGRWKLTYANFPLLYSAALFAVSQVICACMVSDLSKEYDLKAEKEADDVREQQNQLPQLVHQNQEQHKKRPQPQDQQEQQEQEQQEQGEPQEQEQEQLPPPPPQQQNCQDQHQHEQSKEPQEKQMLKTQQDIEQQTQPQQHLYHNHQQNQEEEHQQQRTQERQQNQPSRRKNQSVMKPTIKKVIKEAMLHCDTALLLVIAFFETFLLITTDLWVPVIVIDMLGWPANALNGIVTASGVSCLGPCIFLMYRKFTDKQLYYVGIVCLIMYALIQIIFFAMSLYRYNFAVLILYWCLYCICMAAATIVKDVIISCFLAKMVSSSMQSVMDSVRLSVTNVGAVVAMVTAPFALDKLQYVTMVNCFVVVVIIAMMICRKKTLTNPQVIISNIP